MDKEKAEKKRDYHQKRAEFYSKKIDEAKEEDKRIGFKWGK